MTVSLWGQQEDVQWEFFYINIVLHVGQKLQLRSHLTIAHFSTCFHINSHDMQQPSFTISDVFHSLKTRFVEKHIFCQQFHLKSWKTINTSFPLHNCSLLCVAYHKIKSFWLALQILLHKTLFSYVKKIKKLQTLKGMNTTDSFFLFTCWLFLYVLIFSANFAVQLLHLQQMGIISVIHQMMCVITSYVFFFPTVYSF